jgi:serine/threonine protein kinase
MPSTQNTRIIEAKDFHIMGGYLAGRGDYGFVNIVEHQRTKQLFACKYLSSETQLPAALEGLEKEARIMGRLRHRHIAKVFETYIVGQELRIIMEPGDTDLKNLLGDRTKVRECRLLLKRAFGCLACGLAYLYSTEVRHRGILHQSL